MITIDLGDGRTAPMTPPAELGGAFAAVIAEALSWDDARRAEIEGIYRAAEEQAHAARNGETVVDSCGRYRPAGDGLDAAADRIEVTVDDLFGWSCQFGEPEDPDEPASPEAGPYIDTLRGNDMSGAAVVAAAVLARDLHLVTEADFNTATGWWVAAGLPLPPARPTPGASIFADDADDVAQNAADLRSNEYRITGWPIAAVA
jgi:hypothetical protein